jgi:8-oxo-dGTP pyrophosphatase MutT (NUDIX family)
MTGSDVIARRAARVLLVDAAGRVLLLRGFDPARPHHRYWFTVGGGLDADEPAGAGAARELYEETGLRVPAERLGDPVWREVSEFPFAGRWFRQEQDFYLLRVPGWEVDVSGHSELERASVDGHRWWTREELRRTGELFYPRELPDLLDRLLGGGSSC